ncbi:MAG: 16S rRNA (cytosine(1402)-N(4))-methyltransferase RsmH [Chloroflexi bacterium]|nr:16S rRNA (cytosine(1402)-N(4))-methyltransferase RsmH [Chloroflexota bacterium]
MHAPVMVAEVLRYLSVQPGGRFVDCTVGGGGHSLAILEAAAPGGLLLGIDADADAVEIARTRLQSHTDSVRLSQANFRDLAAVCRKANFIPVHGVLFDLGVSSYQLSAEGRGFSFQAEAPLDMRFGESQTVTAHEIVNTYSERDLADLIWRYGEEPASRRIARAIVGARPLATTSELAAVISRAAGGARRRIHPATRTFQALRIAVNDELNALTSALGQALDVLGRGGRLVVIAFHSLEDRIVKQFMRRESRDCICPPEAPACTCGHRARLRLVTKGAARPSQEEVAVNRRSRSARLRAAEKLQEG